MLCSFVEVPYCILTGLQGNGTLFVIVCTILFTIPACPQRKKYLPDRIHGLAHPQCQSVVEIPPAAMSFLVLAFSSLLWMYASFLFSKLVAKHQNHSHYNIIEIQYKRVTNNLF